MYVEVNKAIYITLEASLLFWKKIPKCLGEIGYQRNEYDWCVMKKNHHKKSTILWNVEYLKMSHFDPYIVPSFLANIDVEYGNIAKITIMRGKIHKYFRMTINYSSPGKLIFFMVY